MTAPARNPLTGIAILVLGFFIIPAMDALGKYLSDSYSVWQISWARFFFHFIFLAPFVLWRYRLRAILLPRQGLQILRGGFLMVATVTFFGALALLPLADTLALSFVSPLLVTLLSPWLLGEQVGWRRRAAVFVGFAGVVIIVRPGFQEVGVGTLLALASGCSFAFYVIATKKLAGTAPPIVTLAYTALLGCVVLTLLMTLGGERVWRWPDQEAWIMMAGIGAIAVVGHFLLITAYDYADASLLAPFYYSEMIMSATLGYLVFGDFPDAWTWLGIAIIVASGIYIALRERTLARERVQGVPAAL
jgi:drug/metabolite transporter (DMT)-like permease